MTLLIILSVSSFFSSIPPAVYALVGTIFGGTGLKLLESWLNREAKTNEKRRDLNGEIKSLTERLDVVEEEVSQWRKRAYNAEEQVALLRIMVIKMGGELPEDTVKRVNDEKPQETQQ